MDFSPLTPRLKAMPATLYVGNDNDVYLQGYRVAATGQAVTDALATFTVYDLGGYDADGNPIQGPAIGCSPA